MQRPTKLGKWKNELLRLSSLSVLQFLIFLLIIVTPLLSSCMYKSLYVYVSFVTNRARRSSLLFFFSLFEALFYYLSIYIYIKPLLR